jgi:hypothetical protein
VGEAVVAKASLIVLAIATAAHADDARRYTLADLETLVSQQAFDEALAHAGDVPPSQRTQKWTDVTAAAAAGALASLPDDASVILAIDGVDRQFPQLLKTTRYTRPRGELGLKGLAACWRRSDECGKLALRFVEGDPKLAIDVARLAARNDHTVALSLFFRAFDPKLCPDEQLQRAMIAGLNRDRDSTPATEARSIMLRCWHATRPLVLKAFEDAGKRSYMHRNTCDVLASKNELSPLQAKRCK